MAADANFEAAIAHAIRDYRQLLVDFVNGDLTADDFEVRYTRCYLAGTDMDSSRVFDLVDGFFAEADAYVADPRLRDRDAGDLDADELRLRAAELLRAAGLEP